MLTTKDSRGGKSKVREGIIFDWCESPQGMKSFEFGNIATPLCLKNIYKNYGKKKIIHYLKLSTYICILYLCLYFKPMNRMILGN